MESLLVGVGDNPPLAPPRSGEGRERQEEQGMSEEVGAKFYPSIFLSEGLPFMRAFLRILD
ncbi:hypothetical protein [Okeania sp. SIO1I7]|uniref:hypothetical protein n=1 Tax=Okeania sp. SIO1I7 TaxID=2607772 RepID=UPI0013F8E417|nr:hypothetical protein [Okeania sp. SIO1I7]NET27313.1 hypothetical protein [Okeania sp. SIO1I7]